MVSVTVARCRRYSSGGGQHFEGQSGVPLVTSSRISIYVVSFQVSGYISLRWSLVSCRWLCYTLFRTVETIATDDTTVTFGDPWKRSAGGEHSGDPLHPELDLVSLAVIDVDPQSWTPVGNSMVH